MPGISFICDFEKDLRNDENVIQQALASMRHFDHYKDAILLKDKSYFLGSTTYDEYPLYYFQNHNYIVCLEGKIYGKENEALNKELNFLANIMFHFNDEKKNKLVEWLMKADGDFIIIVFNKKTKEIYFLNDALSRLPLYYYLGERQILISREIKFIAALRDNIEFDKMAIAQNLLFGYPLGRRTLFKNVHRLGPSSLIRIDLDLRKVDVLQLHSFNFQDKIYGRHDITENAANLVELLSESVRRRYSSCANYQNVLSLSGGLDSRSIGACLKANGLVFSAASYLDIHNKARRDVDIAQLIAQKLNADFKIFQLSVPKGKDYLRLLSIKDGMNYLGMSFILPFFESLKKTYGTQMVYLTGDGGDKVLPDQGPGKRLRMADDLINTLILKHQIFPVEQVSLMTGIDKTDIIDELRKHVNLYPEDDLNQKYVHFIIYERGFKLNFEGEDRNRAYFWSLSPFYSISLFDYSMKIPDTQKMNYMLYGEFLWQLSPELSRIKNKDWNAPITSSKTRLKLFKNSLLGRVPQEYKRVIRRLLPGSGAYDKTRSSTADECLNKQIENCSAIGEYLLPHSFIHSANQLSEVQCQILFTITSIIENFSCSNAILKEYSESYFN